MNSFGNRTSPAWCSNRSAQTAEKMSCASLISKSALGGAVARGAGLGTGSLTGTPGQAGNLECAARGTVMNEPALRTGFSVASE
ncbi:hypothetical protein VT84_22745 [Gemmata sp. SH-PL17]|nr:hypothetical protein VT84_22745 [Gemmata sp. SH-PL17]